MNKVSSSGYIYNNNFWFFAALVAAFHHIFDEPDEELLDLEQPLRQLEDW